MKKYRENEQVIRFLKGLNEQHAAVRSQTMLMKPLPDISDAFALLIQQEMEYNSGINDSKLIAYVSDGGRERGRGKGSNGGQNSKNAGNNTKVCTHCNRTGHTVDYCYTKYGFQISILQIERVLLIVWEKKILMMIAEVWFHKGMERKTMEHNLASLLTSIRLFFLC